MEKPKEFECSECGYWYEGEPIKIDGYWLCKECAVEYTKTAICEGCGKTVSKKYVKKALCQDLNLVTHDKHLCQECRISGCDICGAYTSHVIPWGDKAAGEECCLACAYKLSAELNSGIRKLELEISKAKEG